MFKFSRFFFASRLFETKFLIEINRSALFPATFLFLKLIVKCITRLHFYILFNLLKAKFTFSKLKHIARLINPLHFVILNPKQTVSDWYVM